MSYAYRPKGWWKNPEKYAKKTEELPEAKKMGNIANTVKFGDEAAVQASHDAAERQKSGDTSGV